MKVVGNLMKLILEKKFTVFGLVLKEICLSKVRSWDCLYENENEKLNYCYALFLDLKLMRLKAKIFMNMLRSMSTMK